MWTWKVLGSVDHVRCTLFNVNNYVYHYLHHYIQTTLLLIITLHFINFCQNLLLFLLKTFSNHHKVHLIIILEKGVPYTFMAYKNIKLKWKIVLLVFNQITNMQVGLQSLKRVQIDYQTIFIGLYCLNRAYEARFK